MTATTLYTFLPFKRATLSCISSLTKLKGDGIPAVQVPTSLLNKAFVVVFVVVKPVLLMLLLMLLLVDVGIDYRVITS